MITKPIVFNYREHEELREAYKELLEEVQQLRRDRTNLAIRCRILEAEKIPEWKPIEENRPAIAGNYLVSFEDGFVCSASYDGDYWFCYIQMAMKWLRKEKDVQIEISIVGTDTWESPTKWMYGFRCQTKDVIDRRNADFSSYEEACEAAIKYCLENLI